MIVGFCGLIGSGKTTAAKRLEHHGFTRVRFAGPLKDMMRALGLSDDEIEGNLKETPCDVLGGRTPRQAMQTLGTEWGRDLIHPDLWVNAWRKRAQQQRRVVADDVRFPNEAIAILDLGGMLVRITRSGLARAAHASEQQDLLFAQTIINDGDVAALEANVDAVLARLTGLAAA